MPGEALCGIETDKAVIDYEMQEEGYIAKILYADGAKDIALGECIAILVEEEADVAAFANYTGEAAPVQAAPAQAAPAKAAAPAKSYPDHIILEMPNLSPTMEKVSRQKILFMFRVTSPHGPRRSATRSCPVRHFAVSRPIRPLLITKCKKKATSQRSCTPMVPRISHSVNVLPFWSMMLTTSQLLPTGHLALVVQSLRKHSKSKPRLFQLNNKCKNHLIAVTGNS